MSLQVYLSKKKTQDAFISNLKLSIACQVFNPTIKPTIDIDGEKDLILINVKTGFELIDANTIVKYLKATSKNNSIDDFKNLSVEIEKFDYNAEKINENSIEQILIFIDNYFKFSKLAEQNGEKPNEQVNWFNNFKKLPKIESAITFAIQNSKVDRVKEENKGHKNVLKDFEVRSSNPNEKILPKDNERNILITSALPYVNNVPHLGNIIGSVLSADIFARYCKDRNYNTLFICGTDEYGTATETKALEEKVSPRELCTKYHKIHKEVYDWFQIDFDYFGRTTTEKQTEIAQDIFLKLNKNDYLEEQSMKQLYCPKHNGFLADRFVEGECPKCHYEDARGDQCDKCGGLLDPFELINPRCKLDNETPIPKVSNHIFLSLDKLEPELKEWIKKSSDEGSWSKNAKTITNSWLREGLKPRCITRDLIWGTPVPLKNFENKVLYVWFDATIGYISITANYTDDWKKWWQNDENVKLYQFMGKDNVPFHTVVFPATEIGTRDPWTMLYHLNTTEYLQYEGGKFSKSRGVGVFGNNAKDTGISASVWRYYLASIRPENQDSQFSWAEFVTKNNSELLSNLGNFVNRIVKFVNAKYNGVIPAFDTKNCQNFTEIALPELNSLISNFNKEMESNHLRRGLELAMLISARGNQFLQDNKLDNSLYDNHPDKADAVVAIGLNIVYLVSSVIGPYMPEVRAEICKILRAPHLRIPDDFSLWLQNGHCIGKAKYLFNKIDEKNIDEWRNKYGGVQK